MHIFENHGSMEWTTMKGADTMNPRIFISSTFYDLRYAREDLGNFIRDLDSSLSALRQGTLDTHLVWNWMSHVIPR